VQLIEMRMIDATLIVHAVGHVKMIIDAISYTRIIDGLNTVIYLFQQVLTISRTVSKSKKTVVFF
jgi:hypothetical protein